MLMCELCSWKQNLQQMSTSATSMLHAAFGTQCGSPPKQPLKQQIFGPYYAVDGLVWCVTDGTHRIGLGSLFGLTLKAFSLAPHVDSCLQSHQVEARGCLSTTQVELYGLCFSDQAL